MDPHLDPDNPTLNELTLPSSSLTPPSSQMIEAERLYQALEAHTGVAVAVVD